MPSQLYLLVKHCIFIIEIVVVYNDLYDIHEKFEYSCDVTNESHPHPLLASLLCLKGPTFGACGMFPMLAGSLEQTELVGDIHRDRSVHIERAWVSKMVR